MIGQGVLDAIAVALLGEAWSYRRMLLLAIQCNLWQRSKDIRIALSAILRLSCGDQYVLVRNLHRPQIFAPFGGVVKYHASALDFLDSIEFKPQTLGPGDDMLCDLRGFLPRKNLCKFIRWFKQGLDRESEKDCILRELQEELGEINVDLPLPSGLQLRFIRSVQEGPIYLPSPQYMQFRIFDVYTLVRDASKDEFCLALLGKAHQHNDLLLVSRKDVERGASDDGQLIAPHSRYLFDNKMTPIFIPMIEKKPELPI